MSKDKVHHLEKVHAEFLYKEDYLESRTDINSGLSLHFWIGPIVGTHATSAR